MSEELDRLYDRALALPHDARASFIAEACAGDEDLQVELLSLIAAADGAESFFAKFGDALQSPPVIEDVISGATASRAPMLQNGAVVGRYSIVALLGRGGMGTVYRARDTRLDREVALKFLYPHIGIDDDSEARLLAEARAAAALEHPNICVVHEIGETAEGQSFIAMALCEGQTLKQRLKSGAIAPDEAVAIVTQVARALNVAHSRRIIHRDVKPGNIIVSSDGTAKLLDFGLAQSSDVTLSRSGSTPGTIAYMSPEQVRGDNIDHRSDLWSLGVVFYEMLTSQRPFRGGNDRVILQGILHDEPEPLRNVPPHLAEVVKRLLSKDPEARYENAELLLADLTRTAAHSDVHIQSQASRPPPSRRMLFIGAASAIAVALLAWLAMRASLSSNSASASQVAEPSIAVLPLTNLSADSVDAVFAVGMTEDLIATLARAGGARVIASTSTSAFKNRKLDVRQIAESLGVSNVLEGGVRKNGSRLSVEVRLISASNGLTMWAQAYEGELKDLFAFQDAIVGAVAGELGLRFDRERQIRRHNTRNVTAYELYLRGSDPLLNRSESGIWKAADYFKQAIAIDSNYAAAHAGLSIMEVRRGRTANDPGMPLRELFALAETSARKATAIDDSLPEAHYALGRVLEAELQFPAAKTEIRRAIALDPGRSNYHRSLAYLLEWDGRPEDVLAEARRALDTDPLNPYAIVAVAGALAANHRPAESLTQLDRIAAIKPQLQAVAFVIAQCYFQQNRLSEAIAVLRPQAEAGDPMFRGMLGYMLARDGQRDEANEIASDLQARHDRTGVGAFQVAMVQAGLGDFDSAFVWLDKSIDDRSIGSVIMGPTFEKLQKDPRFKKLNVRLGLQN
jgi:serine/threonine-protein kinase